MPQKMKRRARNTVPSPCGCVHSLSRTRDGGPDSSAGAGRLAIRRHLDLAAQHLVDHLLAPVGDGVASAAPGLDRLVDRHGTGEQEPALSLAQPQFPALVGCEYTELQLPLREGDGELPAHVRTWTLQRPNRSKVHRCATDCALTYCADQLTFSLLRRVEAVRRRLGREGAETRDACARI